MTPSITTLDLGPLHIDVTGANVTRDRQPIELRPQAFRALLALAQHTGQFISYEQLLQAAWEGNRVSKHTVAVTVNEVKHALGSFGAWITYRPRFGYRLEIPPAEDQLQTGWHFVWQRTREGLEKALACFERAEAENANDGRASHGIAVCHLLLGTYGMHAPRIAYAKFRAAYAKAAATMGETPELRADWAHALHLFEYRLEEAKQAILEAYPHPPMPGKAFMRLAMIYCSLGETEKALAVVADAYAANPLQPELPALEAMVRFVARDYAKAAECGRRAVELHPFLHLSRLHYGLALEYAGHAQQALEQYRIASVLAPDMYWFLALEGRCLARMGRTREAEALLDQLREIRETSYVDAYHVAQLLHALDRQEEAKLELDRAFEEGSTMLHLLHLDPKMDGLRDFTHRLAAGARSAELGNPGHAVTT